MESQKRDLSHEQVVALSKLVSATLAREASASLGEGDYDVDFIVRVFGRFHKGADYEQRISAKADPWGLLALALSKLNGVTVEALVREWAAFSPENAKEVKEQAQAALSRIKAPTVTRCTGKISKVRLDAELLPVVDLSSEEERGEVA